MRRVVGGQRARRKFRQICAAMQGTAVIDLDLKDNFVSTSEKAFVQRTYQLRMMTLQV